MIAVSGLVFERRGNTFKKVFLTVTTRIWPRLSCMCHIYSMHTGFILIFSREHPRDPLFWKLGFGAGCFVFGVWCVVYSVWCVVCGVWCVVCGFWGLRVWGLGFGVWDSKPGV